MRTDAEPPTTHEPQVLDGAARSLARAQRSLFDQSITYPLWPVLTQGCPTSSSAEISYPLDVDFDYESVDPGLFDQASTPTDLRHWAPLLTPLDPRLGAGVGGTPLLDLSDLPGLENVELFVKDESRNPTWSHKDRLNSCAVSAAALSGAPGVVVASSGNHGASAAAMAARAGLPCVVIMSTGVPPAVQSFVASYGAAVWEVPREARWGLVHQLTDRLGFHPVSNMTASHTGHPFGPEGYKTIAYELYLQLGRRVPSAVLLPTGYGELLFGVWKGFEELVTLGLVDERPRIYACEVAGRGVLSKALRDDDPGATVPPTATDAYSMATTTGGYRGLHVMRRTQGRVLGVDDSEMARAQNDLARMGLWQELSGASSLAGLRQLVAAGEDLTGPVVCVCTSSGFKDKHALGKSAIRIDPEWDAVSRELEKLDIVGAR